MKKQENSMKPLESREIADKLQAYKIKQLENGAAFKDVMAFEDEIIKLYEERNYKECIALLDEAMSQ